MIGACTAPYLIRRRHPVAHSPGSPGRPLASGSSASRSARGRARRGDADRVLDRHRLPVRRAAQLARSPLRARPAAGPRRQAVGLLPRLARRHRRPHRRLRGHPVADRELPDPALVGGGCTPAWNTAFLFWVAALVWMRSRTNPRFDGGWVWPLACLLAAGVWLNPLALNVAARLPAPAAWRSGCSTANWPLAPAWRPAYRARAARACPLLLGVLWWQPARRPGPARRRPAHRRRSRTTPAAGSSTASRRTSWSRPTRSWRWCITACGSC